MSTATALLIALLLDAAFGEPRWLWSRLRHPAVVMGDLVSWLEQRLNTGESRRTAGIVALGAMIGAAGVLGLILAALPFGWMLEVALAAALLAQRSLSQHVRDVARALRLSTGDGRLAVARIVGRDTSAMDDTAIARAAIESAAENLSDGVVAPAFWFLVAGLPGLLIYKMVNTADSMIGYRTDRFRDFGWAAARFDDLLNWVPARLTALLIALAHRRTDIAPIVRRDAAMHRSPNAGWPEAAMAATLDISLAGPRSYDGELRDFPLVHPEGRPPNATDIDAVDAALWRSWVGMTLIIAAVALLSTLA